MPDAEPVVQKTVSTTETTKASTEAAAAAVISPAPAVVPDDGPRKWIAGIDSVVFLVLVGGICGYLIYHQGIVSGDILAILIMVVQAMIGVIQTERNYFFGSSSGSTQKTSQMGKP